MRQGKRKDQVEFSQRITFWSFIGIITLAIILSFTESCNQSKVNCDENIDMECGDSDEYKMWITGEGDTIWE